MCVEGGLEIQIDIYLEICWNETYMSRWYQYLALPGRRNPIGRLDKQQPCGERVLLRAAYTLLVLVLLVLLPLHCACPTPCLASFTIPSREESIWQHNPRMTAFYNSYKRGEYDGNL